MWGRRPIFELKQLGDCYHEIWNILSKNATKEIQFLISSILITVPLSFVLNVNDHPSRRRTSSSFFWLFKNSFSTLSLG